MTDRPSTAFRTPAGERVPAITAEEMRHVDRVAVDDFGLPLAQMMEHAGRSLARVALASGADRIVVLAGRGGNGGGGLACARHLAARDRLAAVVCSRDPASFSGAPATQLRLLERTDAPIVVPDGETTENDDGDPAADSAAAGGFAVVEDAALTRADLVVDALIGYGLSGPPRGVDAALIAAANGAAAPVVSLDVPSGLDASTGATPGVAIEPTRTVTLALPKTGLAADTRPGAADTAGATRESDSALTAGLVLADLGIPPAVYAHADIPYEHPFGDRFVVALEPTD